MKTALVNHSTTHRPLRATIRIVLACALASGCSHPGGQDTNPKSGEAAQTRAANGLKVTDAAARDCPWPADVDHYVQTTLAPRGVNTPSPRLGVFDSVSQGCAILTFTVDENGLVTSADLVSANPPAFGAIAPKILRWSNFASGASTLTEFMVRLGAAKLPSGGAMVSLAFKDSTVNIEVPP